MSKVNLPYNEWESGLGPQSNIIGPLSKESIKRGHERAKRKQAAIASLAKDGIHLIPPLGNAARILYKHWGVYQGESCFFTTLQPLPAALEPYRLGEQGKFIENFVSGTGWNGIPWHSTPVQISASVSGVKEINPPENRGTAGQPLMALVGMDSFIFMGCSYSLQFLFDADQKFQSALLICNEKKRLEDIYNFWTALFIQVHGSPACITSLPTQGLRSNTWECEGFSITATQVDVRRPPHHFFALRFSYKPVVQS